MSASPLELVDGEACFEVVVRKYKGNANEGVEIGHNHAAEHEYTRWSRHRSMLLLVFV